MLPSLPLSHETVQGVFFWGDVFCFNFFPKALRRVLPRGALGQLAQSSLHRVTSMEILAQSY